MDFLTSVIEHMEDALVITDMTGKVLLHNTKAFNLGQQFQQVDSAKQPIENLLMLPREAMVQEVYQNLISDKKPEHLFAEYRGENNVTAYLDYAYTPILDKSGELVEVLVFIRDITQQKVFEKKLLNTIENTRHLVETANALIIGLDTRGYITDWNAYCTQVTGFEKNDVFTRRLAEFLLPPEARESFRSILQRVLAREEIKQFDMPIRDKQGKILEILTSFSPRYSTNGEIVGVIMVAQDITELTEYRKSLEQQVKLRTRQLQDALKREQEVVEMKSKFVSMASHEFRTPLTTLKFILERLSLPGNGHLQLPAAIKSMEKQVDHMLYLLDEFLTYNKQEPGKIKLSIAPIEAKSFLEKLCEEICNGTRNTHIILIDWDGHTETHYTDEKLLRSIATNLLTNAIKFSPGKESVKLLINNTSEYLKLTVIDQGIGMNPEELEKIFEPFSRSENVANIPGTGLGLSIVKRAVSLLNGDIDIHSQRGEGTTITIRLPNMYAYEGKSTGGDANFG
jgi:PAS domain S-box-containing protein